MAQQQNDSLNQMPTSENTYMNDVTGKSFPQNGNNLDPTKNVSNMNESQKGKPSGPNGNSAAAGPVGMPPAHNDASSMHLGPYGHPMQHHHMPPEIEQQQVSNQAFSTTSIEHCERQNNFERCSLNNSLD